MDPPESEKFYQLRAKTDRQILDFIHSKLDMALELGALADQQLSKDNRMDAQASLERADQALSEAQKLMLVVNEPQRRGLDRKLNEAKRGLELLCRKRELLRPLFFTA